MATKKKTKKKLSNAMTAWNTEKLAFVRQYPTMTPTDLVTLASKAGIKLSTKYIYAVQRREAAKSFATAMGRRGNAKAKSAVVRLSPPSTIVSYQTDVAGNPLPKAKAKAKAKAKSVVVRVPADVGKEWAARRKAAVAALALSLEEPKVIALTYKSSLTKDANGPGWHVATSPAPDSDAVVPATRNRHFKQLALEIGLTQAYVLLAELRASAR